MVTYVGEMLLDVMHGPGFDGSGCKCEKDKCFCDKPFMLCKVVKNIFTVLLTRPNGCMTSSLKRKCV